MLDFVCPKLWRAIEQGTRLSGIASRVCEVPAPRRSSTGHAEVLGSNAQLTAAGVLPLIYALPSSKVAAPSCGFVAEFGQPTEVCGQLERKQIPRYTQSY